MFTISVLDFLQNIQVSTFWFIFSYVVYLVGIFFIGFILGLIYGLTFGEEKKEIPIVKVLFDKNQDDENNKPTNPKLQH